MDIIFKDVDYCYMQGTPFEKIALNQFNVTIPSGSFTAVIGHTGSGKSTFIQHINGLLKPTKGTIEVGPYTLKAGDKTKNLQELRKKVGLVFQYPEHQLFEETVEKDISFGPLNFGTPKQTVDREIRKLLPQVGLSKEILQTSPFHLSGGQMRRVAIAGVLAVEPSVLVLDEPAAGLDPEGREQMMNLFMRYHNEHQTTTILVTHEMEDAAKYADHIIILHDGRVAMAGSREEIFKESLRLREIGLELPDSVRLSMRIEEELGITITSPFALGEIASSVAAAVKKGES